jgi:hypothetical protein
MLNLTLKQSELRIGDRLTGYVQWTGNQPAKEIKLMIQWRTEGRGSIDEAKLHEMILPPEGGRFSYQIPITASYSYDGQLIRIIWEVKLESWHQMMSSLSKKPIDGSTYHQLTNIKTHPQKPTHKALNHNPRRITVKHRDCIAWRSPWLVSLKFLVVWRLRRSIGQLEAMLVMLWSELLLSPLL